MAWNNTVTCSSCWERGHNKAGCPILKERMQKRLEADPDDWRATRYFEKKRRSSKRRCSYCDNAGHNRKTCKELKHAKQITAERSSEWRHRALEHLKNIGLGVGALVKYDKWNNGEIQYAMVKSISWNTLDHRFKDTKYHDMHGFHLSDLGKDLNRIDYNASLPEDKEKIVTSDHYNPYRTFEVVGPLRPEIIDSQVPANWLTGQSSVEVIFDKDTKPYIVSEWVSLQDFYKNQ
mgnify:CR=1 FL=1